MSLVDITGVDWCLRATLGAEGVLFSLGEKALTMAALS